MSRKEGYVKMNIGIIDADLMDGGAPQAYRGGRPDTG